MKRAAPHQTGSQEARWPRVERGGQGTGGWGCPRWLKVAAPPLLRVAAPPLLLLLLQLDSWIGTWAGHGTLLSSPFYNTQPETTGQIRYPQPIPCYVLTGSWKLPPAMVKKSCILFAHVSKGWARHELLASRSQQGNHWWLVDGVGDVVGSGWLSPWWTGHMDRRHAYGMGSLDVRLGEIGQRTGASCGNGGVCSVPWCSCLWQLHHQTGTWLDHCTHLSSPSSTSQLENVATFYRDIGLKIKKHT